MRKPIVIVNSLFAISGLTLLPLLFAQTPPATDDALPTANGNALIHPIGHASVQIGWNGKKMLIDPAPSGGGGGRGAGGGGGRGGGRGGARGEAAPTPSAEALAGFTSLGQPTLIRVTRALGDQLLAELL